MQSYWIEHQGWSEGTKAYIDRTQRCDRLSFWLYVNNDNKKRKSYSSYIYTHSVCSLQSLNRCWYSHKLTFRRNTASNFFEKPKWVWQDLYQMAYCLVHILTPIVLQSGQQCTSWENTKDVLEYGFRQYSQTCHKFHLH